MATAAPSDRIRYAGPPFDKARVHDAMRIGVVTCRPETSLRDVARMMVTYKIHSVVVEDVERAAARWGIVSALDIATAGRAPTCPSWRPRDVATHRPRHRARRRDARSSAAELMAEHGVTHLVAVQPETGLALSA